MLWFLARNRKVNIFLIVAGIFFSTWGFLILRLSQQPEKFAQYWSKPVGDSGGLVYVAMGDSAAQGIGASSPQKAYVSLLANSIAEKSGRNVQIINISQSGATINDVINDQLPMLKNLQFDVLTLDIGGNDLRKYNPTEFESSITKLTAQLPKNTVIADTPYFMHGIWERQAVEASTVLRQQARLNGLSIAPLHMTMQNKGWPSMFYMYAPDWFHPNNRGYEVWHDAFWKTIEPTIKHK
jgi:lysophospholipase L1-like esterase